MTSGPGDSTTIIGKRVKLGRINETTTAPTTIVNNGSIITTVTSSANIAIPTTTTTTSTTISNVNSSTAMNVVGSNGNVLTTARSTTHQKVRRILDKDVKWQDNDPRICLKYSTKDDCAVNNFSIVASRGELFRNNYGSCDSLKPDSVVVTNKKRISSLITKEKYPRNLIFGGGSKKLSTKDNPHPNKDTKKKLENSKRSQNKSPIVLSNSKKGSTSEERSFSSPSLSLSSKFSEESVLRKSTALIASFAQSAASLSDMKISVEERGKSLRKVTNPKFPQDRIFIKNTNLREFFDYLKDDDTRFLSLRPSLSVQTLPTTWRKEKHKKTGIKKSVSFSSDTSFEEKRKSLKKIFIHDAKVYHKGVLEDRIRTCGNRSTKVPPSWEFPPGDPQALLRAAKEADDVLLKQIVNTVRDTGTNKMDVNIVDGSGRSAISYMAGNGTSTMLERALSFEGANPNLPDNEGNTPLHFAAQAGQTECLNILLQKSSDIEVDARNTLGFTPLMKAALQGRTRCAKVLLYAGANPTLRDFGRGLRADQWARFCGRYICAEVIERFARQRLLEKTTSCRWGSEPELAAKVLQGKVIPIPTVPLQPPSTGLRSKIRRVFRTNSGPDRNFSLVTQLTSAALCASSPALPKGRDVPPVVKSLLRPLCVPQLRVTLVTSQDVIEKTVDKYGTNYNEIENSIVKPPRMKKKNK